MLNFYSLPDLNLISIFYLILPQLFNIFPDGNDVCKFCCFSMWGAEFTMSDRLICNSSIKIIKYKINVKIHEYLELPASGWLRSKTIIYLISLPEPEYAKYTK